ncbi:MAG: methyltransferase [Bacillota bacterium]|nr:methyltransferase [Bacillota bacterium]
MKESDLRCDDLIWGGYKLYQDKQGVCFSVDAVLLACFCRVEPGQRLLDAGTGNGVLPLLLLAKEPTLRITGLELQEEAAALAAYNMAINEAEVKIVQGDMMKAEAIFLPESFDGITANPPYYPKDKGRLGKNSARNMAKFELSWDTDAFFEQCSKLLKPGGRVTTCYLFGRYSHIRAAAAKFGFWEDERVLVQSCSEKEPYLVLSSWIGGLRGRTKEGRLVLAESDGSATLAWEKILKERAWRY